MNFNKISYLLPFFLLSLIINQNCYAEEEDDSGKTIFTEIERDALMEFFDLNKNKLDFYYQDEEPWGTEDPCQWERITCFNTRSFKLEITRSEYILSKYRILFPPSFANLTALTELSLSEMLFETFPLSIKQLKNLKTLEFFSSNLSFLPSNIGDLIQLEELMLYGPDITAFPESFGRLTHLKTLVLHSINITTFPQNFAELVNLTSLSIENSRLTDLPAEFGKLVNLEELSLLRNHFTSLPESFSHLTKLKNLIFIGNNLSLWPENFIHFPNLEALYIDSEAFKSFPEKLGIFPKLKRLNLNQLELNNLPSTFGAYPELINLSIQNTNIHLLPEKMGNLPKLKYLALPYNQLTALPQGFGNLKQLKYAFLHRNKLTTLPNGFGENMDLQFLTLNYNELTALPKNFGRGLTLQSELFLDNNKLTSLSDDFGLMKVRSAVYLYHNQLTKLPENFGQITIKKGIPTKAILYILFFGRANNITSQDISNLLQVEDEPYLLKLQKFLQEYNQFLPQYDPLSYLYYNFITDESFDAQETYNFKGINGGTSEENMNMTIIDLKNNKLSALPDSFSQLTNVSYLALNNNKLTTLPKDFGNSEIKKGLSLEYNQLISLPENFGNLVIEELYLAFNQLKSLPDSFSNLNFLTDFDLNLEHNQLTVLPENFGQLSPLKSLSLNHNKLTTLPNSFINLLINKQLKLEHNYLTLLPNGFGQHLTVKEINLNNNQLLELPNSFTEMISLRNLDLSHNKLTILPLNFNNLTGLRRLDLGYNKLIRLPNNFSDITGINNLSLSHNQLTALPANLNQLLYLEQLSLQNNKLSSFPIKTGDYPDLEYLNLAKNKLRFLEDGFSNLIELRYLSLAHNQLYSLPPNFNNLVNLGTLSLNHNAFKIFPDIMQLKGLEILSLGYNQLSELPINFEKFSELRGLFINNNQLSILPPHFDQLANLQRLNISHNLFSDAILNQLKPLSNLNVLSLFNNRFSGIIPSELAHLIIKGDFEKTVPITNLNPDKTSPLVLIVASHNALKPELTQGATNMANFAYRTLRSRQVPLDNIIYLNKDHNQGNDIQVYASPSKAILYEILTQWIPSHISKNQKVILYLVGHGQEKQFIYLKKADGEIAFITPAILNDWLYPNGTKTAIHNTLIYDASFSYYFENFYFNNNHFSCRYEAKLPYFSPIALFGSEGYLSFSFQFWQSLRHNNSEFSFNKAALGMFSMAHAPDPLYNLFENRLDTNCDVLKDLPMSSITLPKIIELTSPKTITDQTTTEISLKVDTKASQLSRVWVSVISPTLASNMDEITDTSEFELVYNPQTQRYTGTISGLIQNGNYQIIAFAQLQIGNQQISEPKIASIFVTQTTVERARLKIDQNIELILPHIVFSKKHYKATFQVIIPSHGNNCIQFILLDQSELLTPKNKNISAIVMPSNLDIIIPSIILNGKSHQAYLEFVSDSNPLTWQLRAQYFLSKNIKD